MIIRFSGCDYFELSSTKYELMHVHYAFFRMVRTLISNNFYFMVSGASCLTFGAANQVVYVASVHAGLHFTRSSTLHFLMPPSAYVKHHSSIFKSLVPYIVCIYR
jgi:hypothetical protein